MVYGLFESRTQLMGILKKAVMGDSVHDVRLACQLQRPSECKQENEYKEAVWTNKLASF